MEKMKKLFPVFAGIALALCVAFVVLYFGENYADKPINRGPLYAAYAYFGSLAILSGFAKFFDFRNSFTAWMCKHSLGLYMFHYLGISSVALFLGKPGKVPASLVYVLSLAAGFLSGFLLFEVISRIPFFRWAVLGITGKNGRGKKHVS